MKVLGLSPLDKDSTVAIVEDGELTYAAAEERFSRVKLQSGFPWRALQDALDRTKLTPDDIDVVSYPFFTWDEETKLFRRSLAGERAFIDQAEETGTAERIREAKARVPHRTANIPGLLTANERLAKGAAKAFAYRVLANDSVISRNVAKRASEQWGREASEYHREWQEELETALEELNLRRKLKRTEHHLSHAVNAFFTSGFDEALVVTLDGYGSGLAGSISIGRDGRLVRVHNLDYRSPQASVSIRADMRARSWDSRPTETPPSCATCCSLASTENRGAFASSRATTCTLPGCWQVSSRRST
jgi:carbamoyltransferase